VPRKMQAVALYNIDCSACMHPAVQPYSIACHTVACYSTQDGSCFGHVPWHLVNVN